MVSLAPLMPLAPLALLAPLMPLTPLMPLALLTTLALLASLMPLAFLAPLAPLMPLLLARAPWRAPLLLAEALLEGSFPSHGSRFERHLSFSREPHGGRSTFLREPCWRAPILLVGVPLEGAISPSRGGLDMTSGWFQNSLFACVLIVTIHTTHLHPARKAFQ